MGYQFGIRTLRKCAVDGRVKSNLFSTQTNMQDSIHGHTEFSLAFTKEVIAEYADQNIVFSPLSISVALRMVAAGAKGRTLDQFYNCLKMKKDSKLHEFSSQLINDILKDASSNGGPNLSFVNGMWVDQSEILKPTFEDIIKKHYNTQARMVDIRNKAEEVRIDVNKWAANSTKGKIQELLPVGCVNPWTTMIMANALHFKGTWKNLFHSARTEQDAFTLLDGGSVQVPMMTTADEQYVKEVDNCKILCLPYLQGHDTRSFSMYIILPNDINGLPELEKQMDLDFLEHHLSRESKVEAYSFQLPRFMISFGLNAGHILKKIGLELQFSDEPNFIEMIDPLLDDPLFITDVFHKSFVEVNEDGTEAAAATAVLGEGSSCKAKPIVDFIADHPFMFVIKEERSGVILFVGHVLNPLK